MRIENKQLYEFIKDSELIKTEELDLAYNDSQNGNKRLGEILLEKKLVDEVKLRELYAYILGVPFVDLSKEIVPADILQIVPEPIAKKYKIVAFEKNAQELKLAMLNPEDIQTVDFIRKKTGLKIITCLTSENSINVILKQYEKSLKAEFGDIIEKNSS
ncbi:MAG: hypothetical protein U0944_01970, partial [Candidatus Moranbacteria bacterium]|nr:hypothetical protein [Candidatus Moranbacteria bacterium]